MIELLELYSDDPLKFYCWDFGGQEIYHGTHRLFLSAKSLQLIVFDPELEDQPVVPDRITGEKHRNLKVEYWERYINEISPSSKLIIVQNKLDKYNSPHKKISIDAADKNIPFIHLSAKKGNNIDDLTHRLKKVAHSFREYGMPMPTSWYNVREYFLKNITEAIPVKTMSLMHYRQLCIDKDVSEDAIPVLLRYLHDTGIVYYNEKFLEDTVIIDQRWALDAIYKVLDRSGKFYDMLRNEMNGKCRVKYLFAELGENYSREQKELLLDFMLACGLCFVVRENEYDTISDATVCVFPEFLSEEIPPTAKLFMESKENSLIHLQKQHPFLHYYTIQQFIALLSPKTDLSFIWKNGIIVHSVSGSFKVEGNFDSNTIQISMEKSFSRELIEDIIYKIEGASEKSLDGWIDIKSNTKFDLLSKIQFDNVSNREIEKNINNKKDSIENLPSVNQTKPKEIVFSYAKEDIETLELIRKHLGGPVQDNLITVWYDKNLSNTRNWDGEIQAHFESCNAIIIIGSSDYISPDKSYIWQQEIPIILNRLEKENLFVIRINASDFYPPKRINAINSFQKGKAIPTSKIKKNEFVAKFINEEIANKLLKYNP